MGNGTSEGPEDVGLLKEGPAEPMHGHTHEHHHDQPYSPGSGDIAPDNAQDSFRGAKPVLVDSLNNQLTASGHHPLIPEAHEHPHPHQPAIQSSEHPHS